MSGVVDGLVRFSEQVCGNQSFLFGVRLSSSRLEVSRGQVEGVSRRGIRAKRKL